MISRSWRIQAIFLFCCETICLGGTYKQSTLPREEVALLTNDTNITKISIEMLDGVRKGVPTHGSYELLPGKHCVRLVYKRQIGRVSWSGDSIVDYYFYAPKGVNLKLVCEEIRTDATNGSWRFWIEDANTGKKVIATGYDVSKLPDPSIQKEPSTSLVDIMVRAMDDDPAAQYLMGYCFEKGKGVTVNYQESMQWYVKSAGQGFARAIASIGANYLDSRGVPQNYEEGVRWLRMAADREDAKAQFDLGICYSEGKGVPIDLAEAAKWYKKSSENGNTDAQYKLGDCYASGKGIEKDLIMAYAWSSISSNNGNFKASLIRDSVSESLTSDSLEKSKAIIKTLSDEIETKKAQP